MTGLYLERPHRTAEQVQEEEVLMAELKKIQMRKKERERKQQDLQKLISAAEQNSDRLVVAAGVRCRVESWSVRRGSVKKQAGSSKKLKSGASGHSKVSPVR